MLQILRQVEAEARAPTAPQTPSAATVHYGPIYLAETCLRRQGLPLAAAFRAAAKQVEHGERLATQGRRLVRLFQTRHALGAVAAILVRLGAQYLVADTSEFVQWRSLDALALVSGCLLGFLAPGILRRILPPPWTAKPHCVAHWLTDFAGDARQHGEPWSEQLHALRRRELLLGVSLADQRRAHLRLWARRQHDKLRADIDRLADLLPLFELIGIGLPAALIMAVPVSVFLRHSVP